MENIKRLTKIDRKAFVKLHNVAGFDFEKPFACIVMEGSFTLNKVAKAIAEYGYHPGDKVVMLVRNPRTERYSRLHIVGLRYSGIEIDYRCCGFETFYRKGDFEMCRKMPHIENYIIVQDKKYIRKPEERTIDFSARYKVAPVKDHWSYYSRDTNCYTIDKSGYILDNKREDLRRRASALRADRKKKAYLQADQTEKLEELRALIAERKKQIVSDLENAQTAEEVNRIGEKLYFSSGFYGVMAAFERFEDNTKNRKYDSIEESDRGYQYIREKLISKN